MSTVLLPASKVVLPDIDVTEDAGIAGTAVAKVDGPTVEAEHPRVAAEGAETTVAMAEMLLVDDDSVDSAVDANE